MATYHYTARDATGLRIAGYLQGETENDIITWLRNQSCTPVTIDLNQEEKQSRKKDRNRAVRAQDLASLCWQLGTLVEGGVPITDSLDTISSDIGHPRLQTAIRGVSKDMRTGESFHESLSRHPKVFNHLFCAMIQAGESGGTITTVLQRMADYYDRRDEIKGKLKKAMAYPVFVLVFIILVVVALMVFVVPRFETVFADLGSKIPAFTQAFMAFYYFLKNHIFTLLGGIGLLIAALVCFGRTKRGQQVFSALSLRLPMAGTLMQYAFLAMYGRTTATLLHSGVSILDAHQIVIRLTNNNTIRKALAQTTDQIAEGLSIADSMTNSGFFPRLMTRMVQVGEDSGSLPAVLDRTSTYFEKKVDVTISTIISILEPALIAVVGVIVLTVLIALYLPVFVMSDVGSAAG